MISFRRESSLADPVAAYFNRKSYHFQERELPFFDYRIDLYNYSRPSNMTVAVEFKLTNWRRAFEQSLIYQLCADLVYIAMPAPFIHRVDLKLLSTHGIGLISVAERPRCRQIIAPIQSQEVRSYYKNDIVEILQGDNLCLQ